MSKIDAKTLAQRQSLPLDQKIALSRIRIRDFYNYFNGDVYISFSGGKDSTVLLDLIKNVCGLEDIPAVFVNTGLEYPEVHKFALSKADIILQPKMTFKQVIDKYGYPVIGKRQANMLHVLQNETEKNKATCNLHRTGYTKEGKYCPSYKLPEKYKYLIDAPFPISDKCCSVMKKNPAKQYEKETGRHPILGTMAVESLMRKKEYLRVGCNAFEAKRPFSAPLGFWTEQDILEYLDKYNLDYASIYGDIIFNEENGYSLTGMKRTGCCFCAFGIMMEDEPNRFQRMKDTHPKLYNYCMQELGMDEVLNYMNINH